MCLENFTKAFVEDITSGHLVPKLRKSGVTELQSYFSTQKSVSLVQEFLLQVIKKELYLQDFFGEKKPFHNLFSFWSLHDEFFRTIYSVDTYIVELYYPLLTRKKKIHRIGTATEVQHKSLQLWWFRLVLAFKELDINLYQVFCK